MKEFPDIEFQRVAVRTTSSECVLGVVTGPVGTHTVTAGKGLVDKCFVKERIDDPIDRVLHDYVSERRGVDDALLGLENSERVIRPGSVGARVDLLVECLQVAAEACLEIEAGPLLPFAFTGIEEGLVQVLPGKYSVKKISVSFQKMPS